MKNIAEIKQAKRVEIVMADTGCTEKLAREELIAEEWSIFDAIRSVKHILSQKCEESAQNV